MQITAGAPRIAIYGRHSTDKQNPNSSADQVAACQALVKFLDGEVVGVYLDPEVSGYRRDRPELKRLLADIRSGAIDIVVSESLDRLARDPEDVSWLGKKLKFDRVQLWTISENKIDDVKLAVASMLGALFISQLRQKVHRGQTAAVLAGRFAGGKAYGYRKVNGFDQRGQPLTGLLEIHPGEAEVVRQIFASFAGGLSAILIAKQLNEAKVPGPRGGQWNASTIRGDPKKSVGILNNELYVGRMVWNRREWRKNPDSDRRERLYRVRDEDEWLRVEVPDLRIVSDTDWNAVRAEIDRRAVSTSGEPISRAKRKKHLLSGLIKCSHCGANYTISGKDYYRCASEKERGTCVGAGSIRKGALEHVTLSVLQNHLLTEEHARIFVDTFNSEVTRRTNSQSDEHATARERLVIVEAELANLAANMASGVLGPTLMKLLGERETEKAALEARLALPSPAAKPAKILPHPVLIERFQHKVADLCTTLNDETIRTEAAELIGRLIESVTIHRGPHGLEAEIVANVADLARYALNDNAGVFDGWGSSVLVVAGVGFEPTTFRL